jgi:hypothetical protein
MARPLQPGVMREILRHSACAKPVAELVEAPYWLLKAASKDAVGSFQSSERM